MCLLPSLVILLLFLIRSIIHVQSQHFYYIIIYDTDANSLICTTWLDLRLIIVLNCTSLFFAAIKMSLSFVM